MQRSFIVVGAGIIGAATALALVKAGYRVKIISGAAPDATAAAFGWINASFFHDADHHRLRSAGIAAWQRLLSTVSINVEWRGCLCWDLGPDEMDATHKQLLGLGYPVHLLDRTDILEKEPALKNPPDRALFFPSEGAAQSQEIAAQLIAAYWAKGGQVLRNVYVNEIIDRGDKAGVKTPEGEILADKVIIAAGTGTQKLAATLDKTIPLVSRPAYILRTTPQQRLLTHVLATPDGELRQEPDGAILMPVAVGHQGDDATILSQTPDAAADDAMKRLRKLCAGLEQADWAEIIKAERPVPADGLPVVGALTDKVYVAVLHSGITLGPLMGELIAQEVTGRLDNADAAMMAPYRPDRFGNEKGPPL